MSILDTAWKDQAACKEFPDTKERKYWFPEKNYMEDDARDICRLCPVSTECLRAALINKEQGNHAGMTQNERRRFAKSEEGRRFLATLADKAAS